MATTGMSGVSCTRSVLTASSQSAPTTSCSPSSSSSSHSPPVKSPLSPRPVLLAVLLLVLFTCPHVSSSRSEHRADGGPPPGVARHSRSPPGPLPALPARPPAGSTPRLPRPPAPGTSRPTGHGGRRAANRAWIRSGPTSAGTDRDEGGIPETSRTPIEGGGGRASEGAAPTNGPSRGGRNGPQNRGNSSQVSFSPVPRSDSSSTPPGDIVASDQEYLTPASRDAAHRGDAGETTPGIWAEKVTEEVINRPKEESKERSIRVRLQLHQKDGHGNNNATHSKNEDIDGALRPVDRADPADVRGEGRAPSVSRTPRSPHPPSSSSSSSQNALLFVKPSHDRKSKAHFRRKAKRGRGGSGRKSPTKGTRRRTVVPPKFMLDLYYTYTKGERRARPAAGVVRGLTPVNTGRA